jgi:NADH pyrophosphatase NudC (nudix superfamily)
MAYEPPKHCSNCGAVLSEVAGAPGQRRCGNESCGRITYLSPIPVVAAIVEHEGEVVLVRGQGWPETWFGLVTGFLEPKESPEEAAWREVKEELGLAVAESALIGAYPFAQMNQVIIAYHVTAKGVPPLAAGELSGYKRVPLDQLKPWDFGTGYAVKDFLAERDRRARAQKA